MASFYIDNDVSLRVATCLRSLGHDATTARDENLEDAYDDEHLFFAFQRGRVLVTHNSNDFRLLHDAWRRWSSGWDVAVGHAGILAVPQQRKYGIDWDPPRIAEEITHCVHTCPLITNQFLERRGTGWHRWVERNWVPCP